MILLWILLAVLCIFLLLLLIAVIHTLTLKLPTPAPRPACSRDPQELQKMGEDFARMIRVETISRNPGEDLSAFDKLHEVIDDLFPLCKKNLEKTVLDGVLLYHWKGKDANKLPILLMGHQDVVPANPEEWSTDPFGGAVKDGKLYGRGTIDDKCNIFTQMSAIEDLLHKGFVPEQDVWLEYSVNEEISGPGAANAVKWFQEKGIRFACAWDEGGAVVDKAMAGMDRPYAVIGITEKGYIDLKITAKGEGGHSSAPKASTTVSRLADFMHEVNHKQPFERVFTPHVEAMFANMAPAFGFGMRLLLGNLWLFKPLLRIVMPKINATAGALLGTTCTFTMMHGAEASNVIPTEAYVIANLRTGFTQDTETCINILKKIGKKYDLEFEVLSRREASPVTPTDSPVYQYLVECIHRKFPDCGCSPYVMTGGTDNRSYPPLTENCLRFYPVRVTSRQLGTMHGIDENIDLDACSDAIDFYEYFIENYK
jgi:carboxypeptidase PM20D1